MTELYGTVPPGAVSSAGRAPALHAGGRRFESCTAHFHRWLWGLAQPCAPGVSARSGSAHRSLRSTFGIGPRTSASDDSSAVVESSDRSRPSGKEHAMGKFKLSISMSLDGYVAVPTRARRIHSGSEASSFTSGWFRSGHSARATEGKAARSTRARRSPRRSSATWVRPSWAEHVRWRARTVGRRAVEGLVGRQPSLPSFGLRSHPPPARAAGDAGRNHLSLRHGWNRVGPRTGLGSRDQSSTRHAERRRHGRPSAAVPTLRSSIWRRGLLDEILVSIVPVLLGNGARLFDHLDDPEPKLEQVEAIEAPGVTHIRYTRV